MISFYISVVLINGQVDHVLNNGFYTTPGECYSGISFPKTEGQREEYKCIKAQGRIVDFKVIEVQK